MPTTITVLRIDPLVEEVVDVTVGDVALTCFAVVCPMSLEVGGQYEVELSFFTVDDLDVCDVPDCRPDGFRRHGDSLAYSVVGLLSGDEMQVGTVTVRDPELESNRSWGRALVRVDRIDATFLRRVR